MNRATDTRERPDEAEGTGLPLLRSWRAVYVFVLATFVTCVILLALLSRAFA
ncbi:MAG TPA: hypothetical protein GYA07_08780 [Verrucomicrobia bacterium]|nr:hypothetical protein [Verrucomicrobiota bacterium]HOB33647.1 hypothetical protein [Verrucomicrobiota bacterium]HOP98552.1 hypothetical protein [Verrucomicrobiota bacterium]